MTPELFMDLCRQVRCDYCKSDAFQKCRSRTGNAQKLSHTCRVEWAQAWLRELEKFDDGDQHISREELTVEEWMRVRDKEPEGTLHPCDDHPSDACMCKGACSCHYVAQEKGLEG